ncbi:MAG: Hsp20/alpha crystallin family protein [Geitlerinemataceae cyanobacterium]
MAIVRWNSYPEINTLHREMNQILDSLTPTRLGWNVETPIVPSAEIHETPEDIRIKLELPGIDAKALDIQVSAEAVSVGGERKEEVKTEDTTVTRSEFRYGQFRRTISLPKRVDNTQVKAEYKDGILWLVLPKAASEKNKVVKVNVA